MNKKDFLLSDETTISIEDFEERKKIYNYLSQLPIDFFSKLRHLQPQIGCLNACKICSKNANCRMSFWSKKRQRNVIAALKFSALNYRKEYPLICWDRSNHRNGVVFSYLDNDIGNYYYLDSFIKILFNELGVVTRISTVGYSRYNEYLNRMHRRINRKDNLKFLGGVRLSFTPYELGWSSNDGQKFHKVEYIHDIANFLQIYRPYYKFVGPGSRKFCVELRYKPLVRLAKVVDLIYKNHKIIAANNYLYISKNQNIKLEESYIKDPLDSKISLTKDAEQFYEIDLDFLIRTEEDVLKYLDQLEFQKMSKIKIVDVYLLKNRNGIYYSINPHLNKEGNFGINIYPITESRKLSGFLITERFLLNALLEVKKGKVEFSWKDVNEVVNVCIKKAYFYREKNKMEKYDYIIKEVIPMISGYIKALKIAKYSPNDFFDENFTIDTGIICNLGRALHEFRGLSTYENDPLTPSHEKNYGLHNSKMTIEDYAWRLSCDYYDKIVVEKLCLKETSTDQGQIKFEKHLSLLNNDEKFSLENLKNDFLIPGQVPSTKMYFYKEKGPLGYLASYSKHGLFDGHVYWPTLEHYYQAQKFTDNRIKQKILHAKTPKEASMIGRDRTNPIIKNWDVIKKNIMYQGLYLKFTQNDSIKERLLNTKNVEIIEGTTKEFYWGCGIDGSGENHFGKLLMKVREKIANEERNEQIETN